MVRLESIETIPVGNGVSRNEIEVIKAGGRIGNVLKSRSVGYCFAAGLVVLTVRNGIVGNGIVVLRNRGNKLLSATIVSFVGKGLRNRGAVIGFCLFAFERNNAHNNARRKQNGHAADYGYFGALFHISPPWSVGSADIFFIIQYKNQKYNYYS